MSAELATRLVRRLQRWQHGRVPQIILIDGRSGAGKTRLAQELSAQLSEAGSTPEILPVEHLYPGWEGLAAGSEALARVLDAGAYRRYDWVQGAFAETINLDERRPLIVEGCGALSSASLAAAARWAARSRPHGKMRTWALWLECPAATRRGRALARDGEMFRPHWERWAQQEEALFARTQPRAIADEIVHGGSGIDSGS